MVSPVIPALAAPAIQYGAPALLALIRGAVNLLEKKNNDPNMTQDQFNDEWALMIAHVRSGNDAWEASKATAQGSTSKTS